MISSAKLVEYLPYTDDSGETKFKRIRPTIRIELNDAKSYNGVAGNPTTIRINPVNMNMSFQPADRFEYWRNGQIKLDGGQPVIVECSREKLTMREFK